jgi:hypothetical protein
MNDPKFFNPATRLRQIARHMTKQARETILSYMLLQTTQSAKGVIRGPLAFLPNFRLLQVIPKIR